MDAPQKKRLLWQLPFLTLLIVGTILIIRQQHNMPYQHTADFIFGTTYTVTYQCDSDMSASIKAELLKVDRSLSPFNKQSVITSINNNGSVMPDPMFLEVFQQAMLISEDTKGAFDITVAPLVNAWGSPWLSLPVFPASSVPEAPLWRASPDSCCCLSCYCCGSVW